MKLMKSKGQTGAVLGMIVAMMLIFITAVILQNMDDALAGNFWAGTTYNSAWNNISANSVTGTSLTTLLPILLGVGALIVAVYSFANR